MNGTIEKDQIPNLTAGANAGAPTLTEAAIARKPRAPKTKVATKVAKRVAKRVEPKLPTAGVERLRNGTSSIPSESKTLGMTYGQLQGALKRELGAAGYTALIKANRAAKSKARTGVAKPVAKKSRAKPAKAASKKRSRKVKATQ